MLSSFSPLLVSKENQSQNAIHANSSLIIIASAVHVCVLPGWTNCPCCISCQTGGRIGFLLAAFMWLRVQVGQRWQRLLSARSVTLVGRCSRCTLFGLTLAFWANFWLCVCVCERQIEKERASSGDQPESYRARMAMAANFGEHNIWCHGKTALKHVRTCRWSAIYSSELMMHTFTLTHRKVSHRHLRGFACAKAIWYGQICPSHTVFACFVLLYYIYKCGPLFGPWAALLRGNKNVSDEMLWIFVS